MEALWEHGEGSVHDVMRRMTRRLAYNTVMTTLDRLYKKGLLTRTRLARSFLYAPRLSRSGFQQRQAENLLAGFFAAGAPELLVSCLVNAVEQHDAALLDELEARIRRKREELDRGRKS